MRTDRWRARGETRGPDRVSPCGVHLHPSHRTRGAQRSRSGLFDRQSDTAPRGARFGCRTLPSSSWRPNSSDVEVPDDPISKVAPDLAVEVISESTAAEEMETAALKYFQRWRPTLVWYMYRKQRSADRLHVADSDAKRSERDGSLEGGKVLPGFSTAADANVFAARLALKSEADHVIKKRMLGLSFSADFPGRSRSEGIALQECCMSTFQVPFAESASTWLKRDRLRDSGFLVRCRLDGAVVYAIVSYYGQDSIDYILYAWARPGFVGWFLRRRKDVPTRYALTRAVDGPFSRKIPDSRTSAGIHRDGRRVATNNGRTRRRLSKDRDNPLAPSLARSYLSPHPAYLGRRTALPWPNPSTSA